MLSRSLREGKQAFVVVLYLLLQFVSIESMDQFVNEEKYHLHLCKL